MIQDLYQYRIVKIENEVPVKNGKTTFVDVTLLVEDAMGNVYKTTHFCRPEQWILEKQQGFYFA